MKEFFPNKVTVSGSANNKESLQRTFSFSEYFLKKVPTVPSLALKALEIASASK